MTTRSRLLRAPPPAAAHRQWWAVATTPTRSRISLLLPSLRVVQCTITQVGHVVRMLPPYNEEDSKWLQILYISD